MSKWEQAAVVEDRPKWMDAPEVEPAPGESLADIEARQSETLKAYPGLYDAPWKPADLDAEDKMGEHVESIFHETGRDRGAIIRDMVDLESTPLSPDDRFNAVRGSSLFGLNLSRLAPIPQEDAVAAARHELVAGGPVTTLEKIKQWVRERTGYFEPPIEGPAQRAEHPLGTLAGAGAFYTSSYLSGLGLNIPDILAKPLKGADSLREAVNQTTGFVPTDEEIRAADILDFMGGLKSAGKVAKVVVHRIAARTALRTILQSGVTFAGRDVSKEAARKIITDEPFSLKEIWAQGGIGVLFGIAEVAVATGLDRWTAGKLADEYVRRAPELAQIPRADRIRTAQAALDSHRVTAGEMPMDEWAGKWSEHLQRFSDQLKDLAVRSATTPLQMTGTPAVPAGPAEATPAGLSWMAELRQRARAGEPLLPGEISFLKELGIDPAKEAADALEDQTKAQTALALRSGQGTGASAVAAGVQAPAPGAAAAPAGAEEAVTPPAEESLTAQKQPWEIYVAEETEQAKAEIDTLKSIISKREAKVRQYKKEGKPRLLADAERELDSAVSELKRLESEPIGAKAQRNAKQRWEFEQVDAGIPLPPKSVEELHKERTDLEYRLQMEKSRLEELEAGRDFKGQRTDKALDAWRRSVGAKRAEVAALEQEYLRIGKEYQEALTKLGPQGQVTAQGEAAAPPPAAPALPEKFGNDMTTAEKYEAIVRAIKQGKQIVAATYLRATRIAKPEHIRLTEKGTVQIPEGKNWVTLLPEQVDRLAAQAGIKFEDRTPPLIDYAELARTEKELDRIRTAEITKTTKAIKSHPAYMAAAEARREAAMPRTGVVPLVYFPESYRHDVEAYAGERKRRGNHPMWGMITFDPQKGQHWDDAAAEMGWPDDMDGFLVKLKEVAEIESAQRGTGVDQGALEVAMFGDPELETLSMKRDMLAQGYSLSDINAAMKENLDGMVASEYGGLTAEDATAILDKHRIKEPERGKQRGQRVPGEVAGKEAGRVTKTDTGVFGQTIVRPTTGSRQELLPDAGEEWVGREPERPLLEGLEASQQPPGAKSAVQPPAPAEIGPPAAPGAIVGQTGAALTKAIEAKNFDVLKESLLPGNDAARAQFEDETGIELPESIAGTENTVGEFVAGRLSPPTEPRLPGGAQAGGTTLLPDKAAEITSIAKTVVNNPIRLVTAVWESLKRNMVAATTYMRSLGPAGVKTAGELDDITKDVVTKSNTDQADLRLIHKGVSKSNRERLYQAMNERIPLSSLPPWLQERVAAARAVLDRARSVAQKLGMQVTLPSGEKVDIDFTGKAYPQIPNAEGLRFLEEAYTQGKGSSRVFAWAQEQVNDQRYADVDEAIQALVRFRDSRFRGVNGYLERTRVELPIEMVEWDGTKTLPTVLERNWMTVEGVRRWGNDFERLEGRIEKMREDHGADAAQRVRSYIRTSFGIQSPASRSSQAISNLIRRFQFSTKIALSPLTIGRNMADRLAKGMMASPLATIRASIEYPPFVNAVLPHAQRLEDQMIRHGVVFGHGSLSEGYEAGSFFADLAKSPFASSERGNQVFIGLVHYKKLLHDIAILEREHAGSIGRVENAIRTVFGQSAAQATERVGPKIAAKLAAGEEIEQKDIDRFLHEMVRDRAFPMVLSTKPIWYDAHPMMKVLAQFKTWPVRQTAMIWKDVLKYTIRTGDLTRLIGFVVGTLIAGELYNIARDLLYGRKESVALSDDTPQAVLKDLAYGGLWGVVADLTYGMTDWAGGVSLKTAKNVGVTAHNIWEEWTLAPEAVEKLISQEVAPYRQVKELARRLDNGDLSESYGQWRARAYEWKDTKKAPTAFARISNYAEDIVFGKPEYEIGPNTLALDLASRHVVAGDLESAAQYIEIALKNADNPKEALGGIKASRTRRSPMGGIPQKDWPEFLKSLDPEQRTAVQRVQREYMTAYNKAIGIAAKNARIRED